MRGYSYSETGFADVMEPVMADVMAPTMDETGFIGDIVKAGETTLDIFAGGPQKRERAAKAERDAALITQQTERDRQAFELEMARSGSAQGGGFWQQKTLGMQRSHLAIGAAVLAVVAYLALK